MIEKKLMYETADGELFNTEQKATAHALDLLREVLDRRLHPLCGVRFSRSDMFNVVCQLIPDDPGVAHALIDRLTAIRNKGV